jgi:hypothetical protein
MFYNNYWFRSVFPFSQYTVMINVKLAVNESKPYLYLQFALSILLSWALYLSSGTKCLLENRVTQSVYTTQGSEF